MNTCATCAHWHEPEEWDVKDAGMGRCARIKHSSPHELLGVGDYAGMAENDNDYDAQEIKVKALRTSKAIEAMAIVVDGSGYRADFYSRPEFGCVLWNERVS